MSRLFWQGLSLFGLLLLSGLFSASETALTSISRLRLKVLTEEGLPGAKTVEQLMERPARLLGTLLVANNVINVAATAIGTALSIELIGPRLGIWVATVVIALALLIFGEITPKTLAAQSSESIALRVGPPLKTMVHVLSPLVRVFTAISGLILKLFGVAAVRSDPFITEEELRTIVDVGGQQGVLEEEEREMIHSIFEFGDTEVRAVMRPRIDIYSVPKQSTIGDVLILAVREGFSRIPVYDGSVDNIIGLVYMKDLLRACVEKQTEPSIRELLRPAYYVPETKRVGELFRELQRERVHMAVVLDEFGGTAGIVTIEDLMEEIFGEIEDEYDQEDIRFTPVDARTTIVDARLAVSEVNEQLALHLPENENHETIGGLVFSLFGRVPGEGEAVQTDRASLVVERMTGRRVTKVKIVRHE